MSEINSMHEKHLKMRPKNYKLKENILLLWWRPFTKLVSAKSGMGNICVYLQCTDNRIIVVPIIFAFTIVLRV